MRLFVLILFAVTLKVWATPSAQESIYPCSIGIRHPANYSEPVAGTDHGSFTSNQGRQTVSSSYGNSRFETPNLNPWNTILDVTRFQLGTERFGAQYYLEFCYFGPMEMLTPNGTPTPSDASRGIYQATLDVNIQNVAPFPYAQTAKVFSRYEIACDLRGVGTNTAPRAANEIPGGPIETDVMWSSDALPIFNGVLSFDTPINQTVGTVPRFCSVRVYFNENSRDPRVYKDVLQNFEVFVNIKKGVVSGLY